MRFPQSQLYTSRRRARDDVSLSETQGLLVADWIIEKKIGPIDIQFPDTLHMSCIRNKPFGFIF